MKIWQKIFLATLSVVTFFMLFLGSLLNFRQFKMQLYAKIDLELGKQETIFTDISRKLNENQNLSYDLFVDDIDYCSMISDFVNDYQEKNHGISIKITDINQTFQNAAYLDYIADLTQESAKEPECGFWEIKKGGENYYLISYQSKEISYRTLQLSQMVSVTDIYEQYCAQMKKLQLWGILLAAAAAILLVVVIQWAMRPIHILQQRVFEIAEGEYGKKLEIKGENELTALAGNINHMAGKIQETISDMEQMLENRKLFIGNMAHEMKTPLTTILGFADLLSIQENLTEKQRREYSEYIYQEALRMRHMSAKLLELVGLEGEKLTTQQIDMKALLLEIATQQEQLSKDKNIRFHTDICEGFLSGDPDLLKSLFGNLVENAIKASFPGGQIWIRMYPSVSDGEKILNISVTDSGIGIAKEDISRITEPFYMADKSRSRKEGGAGLGLALCAEIIKWHKGTLKIESEQGKGSTFFVALPTGD